VPSIVMRVEPISPSEMFSQMISYELHLAKQSGGGYSSASANEATRGHGAPWSRGGNNFAHERGRSHGNGRGSLGPSCGVINLLIIITRRRHLLASPSHAAKCAGRLGTQRPSVGTGSMRSSFLINTWLPCFVLKHCRSQLVP
jgi:hypothetical protein